VGVGMNGKFLADNRRSRNPCHQIFIVQDPQTGLLVPINAQRMALKIRHLLDLPQIAVKMDQLTQIRIREKLSWERHIDPYDHLYQELIHS